MVVRNFPEQTMEIPTSDTVDDENDMGVPNALLVQEVRIVKALACNDLIKRNRQMRKLRKWLELRSRSSYPFAEENFMRIWKGLYYNMWMSDKPLVQEELAEQMGKLLESFDTSDIGTTIKFFSAFVRTMCQQWFGIDQWRIDKFLMLIRRMLRYMLRAIKNTGWSQQAIQQFNVRMQDTLLADEVTARGLTMHYLDIFFEELSKVSGGNISGEQVSWFIVPFVTYMGTQRDVKLVAQCRTRVFYHLLYQSALGREYSEKYTAWKEMGFPTSSIDDIEKQNEEESFLPNESEELSDDVVTTQKSLDPRAGNVDVIMAELPFEPDYIIDELNVLVYKRDYNNKRRKALRKLLNIFEMYKSGEFPLGIKTMPRVESVPMGALVDDKVEQLENLEDNVYGVGRALKSLNKRARKKLLKLLDFKNADDEKSYDEIIKKALPQKCVKKQNTKAQLEVMSGWLEEELDMDMTEEVQKPIKKKKKPKTKDISKKEHKHTNGQKHKATTEEATEEIDEPPIKKMKKLNGEKTVETNGVNTLPHIKIMKKQKIKKPAAIQTSFDTEMDDAENGDFLSEALVTPLLTRRAPEPSNSAAAKWTMPLNEGELEFFLPSRKIRVLKANNELLMNPLARKKSGTITSSPLLLNESISSTQSTPKRVKIDTKRNTAQHPTEYIKQIKSSPDVPYDANRKPGKGLLKPNSMPSPINPFYKKKIGLNKLNDTF